MLNYPASPNGTNSQCTFSSWVDWRKSVVSTTSYGAPSVWKTTKAGDEALYALEAWYWSSTASMAGR